MAKLSTKPISNVHRKIGGYQKKWAKLNRIIDILYASFILLLSLPLIAVFSIIIKLQGRGPVFYKGKRYGKDKKIFLMYKLRTLTINADSIIGGELLKPHHRLETPIGKFLRDTRIDEIPQLINVIKGDMDLIGPRPERPEVYEKQCKNIFGYDNRFHVNPGLIGYSQLFTPHSAPKRIRTLIDNIHLGRKQYPFDDTILIVWTLCALIRNFISKIIMALWFKIIFKCKPLQFIEKRMLERMCPKNTKLYLYQNGCTYKGLLGDVNEECIMAYTENELQDNKISISIEIHLKKRQKMKRKTVYCKANIQDKRSLKNMKYKYSYVLKYQPESAFGKYMFDQYFLNKSII